MKTVIYKEYAFIFEDKWGNEIDRLLRYDISIKEARKTAKFYMASSMQNDLKRIRVKRTYPTPTREIKHNTVYIHI